MKLCCWPLIMVCCLLFCSCAHLEQLKMLKIKEECEENVKDYNKLLRWREIENAGMLHLDRTLRDEYLKDAEDIRKRGVMITDYRILTTECLAEKKTAEVLVEFDYYVPPSNRIKTLTYRQNWKYHDAEGDKGWYVITLLPGFE
jgi:hypothetical protein